MGEERGQGRPQAKAWPPELFSWRRRWGYELLLLTNRKLHMGFGLVPKSVNLNDLERRNDHYFCYLTKIGSFGANYVKVVVEVRRILSATKM